MVIVNVNNQQQVLPLANTYSPFASVLTTKVQSVSKNSLVVVRGEEFLEPSQYHFFRLVSTSKRDKVFGHIQLEVKTDSISIYYMKSDKEKYKNVGVALHEIAVRFSYHKKFEGRVDLFSIYEACGFHFKYGFRFNAEEQPMVCTSILVKFTREKVLEYSEICEKYLECVPNEEKEKLSIEIREHKAFDHMLRASTKELEREPVNLDEILSYGRHVLWNANRLLDAFYNHPSKNSKASSCNPSNKRFEYEGYMSLTDQSREAWLKVVQS